jgi:hypothetical protein
MGVTLRGAGQTVVQVVTVSTSSQWGGWIGDWLGTPLSLSITPKSASNRILVTYSAHVSAGGADGSGYEGGDHFWRVVRRITGNDFTDLTPISTAVNGDNKQDNRPIVGHHQSAGQDRFSIKIFGGCMLDAPGTTQSCLYEFQGKSNGTPGFMNFRGLLSDFPQESQMTLMEIAYA